MEKEDQEQDKMLQLEAKLLEQEHRLFKVVSNYWYRDTTYQKSDPRYKAIGHALLWRILFSSSTTNVGGGLLAVFTIVILLWQSKLTSQNNQIVLDNHRETMNQLKPRFSAYGFVESIAVEPDGVITGNFLILNSGNVPLYFVTGEVHISWTKDGRKTEEDVAISHNGNRLIKPSESESIPFKFMASKEMSKAIESSVKGTLFSRIYSVKEHRESMFAKLNIIAAFLTTESQAAFVESEIHAFNLSDENKTAIAIDPDGPVKLRIAGYDDISEPVKKMIEMGRLKIRK